MSESREAALAAAVRVAAALYAPPLFDETEYVDRVFRLASRFERYISDGLTPAELENLSAGERNPFPVA